MDTSPRPRIFISSLMSGYGAVRDAASRAIERADCEPVRAEDFPAGTVSPRTACLDGVASCDGLALILGARYGEPTVVGISATEEEYREAVKLRKHVFVFLEGEDREPRQQEFVRSVEDYVDGHWRKSFATPEQLEGLVEQALREDLARCTASLGSEARPTIDGGTRAGSPALRACRFTLGRRNDRI